MMGPYFQQPRKKLNQKAQGKKNVSGGGGHMYPPSRHLVVKDFHVSILAKQNLIDLSTESPRKFETEQYLDVRKLKRLVLYPNGPNFAYIPNLNASSLQSRIGFGVPT